MSSPKNRIPTVPTLALVFNILGGLVLLGAVAVAVGAAMQFKSNTANSLVALPVIGSLIFIGIVYLGAGEVIQLIARIAIETCRTADAAESAATRQDLYLYQVGEEVRGPVSLDVLRSLRAVTNGPRYVTAETIACRVGETDWKRLADFMDKKEKDRVTEKAEKEKEKEPAKETAV
jgi:hypothetical protein